MVLASAIAVIYSVHTTRMIFAQLEELKNEASDLQVVWGQYLLEHGMVAQYNEIEVVARSQLDMVIPDPAQIKTVKQ
jgi:cell division protein FtsL